MFHSHTFVMFVCVRAGAAQPQALVLGVGDRVSVTRSKTLPKQWVSGVVKKAEGLQVLVQYDTNPEVAPLTFSSPSTFFSHLCLLFAAIHL